MGNEGFDQFALWTWFVTEIWGPPFVIGLGLGGVVSGLAMIVTGWLLSR